MAKTRKGKKIVPVRRHKRNGRTIKPHRRSTPN